MSSLFAVTFIVHSLYMVQATPNGMDVVEMCSLTIDGEDKGIVVGSCKDTGEMLVETWMERHPDKPWHLVVDGFDYNKL